MFARFTRFAALLLSIPTILLAQGPKTAGTKYALAATGNEARFIVRETLAQATLPNDAVGTTTAVTGSVTLDDKGKVDPAGSKIIIDMATLKTDNNRRDGWIKQNTLHVAQFPTTELVIKSFDGFPVKLPASGSFTFVLIGDLTVHGVTKPSTWEVSATANGNEITGKAVTHVKFGDFGMTVPKTMMVLSVVDDIALEYSFRFVKQ